MRKQKKGISIKMFFAILLLVILPLYLTTLYMRNQYESYFKEELGSNITNALAKSEDEIERAFDNLSNVANVFCVNTELQAALQNPEISYYQRMRLFDRIVGEIAPSNLAATDNLQITMLDSDENIYSNWSLDFKDYSKLIDDKNYNNDIVKKGYAVWLFFADPFIYGDKPDDKYIGISRGMLSVEGGKAGDYLATIVVSIRKTEFSKILQKFAYGENDHIVVCNENGEVLMHYYEEGHKSEIITRFVQKQVINKETSASVQKFGEETYLVSHYPITRRWIAGQQTMYVYHLTDYSPVVNKVKAITSVLDVILVVSLAAVVCISAALAWSIAKPVRVLANTISDYQLEKQYIFKPSKRNDEIGQLSDSFMEMDMRMKDLFAQLETENKVKEQYKLDFLRAQLNPHFLFNTLGTIRWMAIAQNMPNIVECVDALGNMLRYSMNKGQELVTLEDELQNIDSYIKIQNYRYGNCYRIENNVDKELYPCILIRFILQPIIENAVLHAFTDNKGDGKIAINARKTEDMLEIIVEDNGKGIDPAALEKLNSDLSDTDENEDEKSRGFNKIGVHNVRQQINIRYGYDFGLRIESDGVSGTRVIYHLPLL